MGTRNLTMVILEGKTKVAQYGQYDGYPEGQGKTALSFMRSADLQKFKEQLNKCRWLDRSKVDEFLLAIGSSDGWMDGIQATLFNDRFPYLKKDHGAGILELIYNSAEGEVLIEDESEFAKESLYCEWAYVIDLDKETFEVYEGWNNSPLPETDRFKPLEEEMESGDKYYPVRFVKSWNLTNLPTDADFLNYFEQAKEKKEG